MPNTVSRIPALAPEPDWDFAVRTIIGRANEGISEPGEVLAAIAGLPAGDHEGWFAAWHALAERTAALADECAAAGHRVSAAGAYLRAATYHAEAVDALSGLDEGEERLGPEFRAQQAAWNGFVAHTSTAVERVDIPYAQSSLPGLLFRSPEGRGATLVAVNGSDGSFPGLWAACVAPALRRGFHVLVFDGPGQQTQLFERDVPFRPDWENVLTPVYDFVSQREGVDPARIVLYGISQGGYWVPRALAFEHRYAAAAADPGVVDVSESWTRHLPPEMLELLASGQDAAFDAAMAEIESSPDDARTWRFRARPYGVQGYAATYREVEKYTVADVAGRITTPLLITDPEGEQFWPGQPERLAALVPDSTLVRFTAAEGADGHCEPLGRALAAQRVFDWLADRVAD
jgi:dienelactone hydrolase